MRQSRGFSVVEVVAATALTLAVAAAIFVAVDLARVAFSLQPELADVEQRLRVASDALQHDISMAGAGMTRGLTPGPLVHYFAPVLPYRLGTPSDDPPGTYRDDVMTVMYVPQTMAQARLAVAGPGASWGDVGVTTGVGCPLGDPLCGFRARMSVLLLAPSGEYDTFTITGTDAAQVRLERPGGSLMLPARAAHESAISEVVRRVYALRADASTGVMRLVVNDAADQGDLPVVDHVVRLAFEYHGDPRPPLRTTVALSDPAGPWTTYGPPPPPPDRQIPTGGYPAGENCTFGLDVLTGTHVPRLAPLGAADSLVRLTAAQLTDGPWCPDPVNPNRWDADLLRVRRITLTIRVEAADAAMRGPAGPLFVRGGSAPSPRRWAPDRQVTLEIAPRNLQQSR